MPEPYGYLSLTLHAHLPFIRHPEHEEFLEEDWLFEAMTETYIPLLDAYERMADDGTFFRVTMSITPPLAEMLADPLLQERYKRRMEKQAELAEKEVHRTSQKSMAEFHGAAKKQQDDVLRALSVFRRCHRNLVEGFKRLQDAGALEVITCCATHGFLPLMNTSNAKRAQILTAKKNYEKHFGRPPRGIWLAECGYEIGADEFLEEAGIRFFFIDSHGILYGAPRPKYGVYAPILSPFNVAVFGRDVESSKQVWSRDSGYPGDVEYREFYRDLGYDAPYEYIRPYLHHDGIRRNIGFKYYRITGEVDLSEKQPYRPAIARERAAEHAGNFMFNRQHQVDYLRQFLDRPPLIVAPYDAELYGHWWYEGPQFLEYLFRKMAHDQKEISAITPSEYLERHPVLQSVQPAASSWGDKGFYEVWLNGSNDWIYRHLHECEGRMVELAKNHPAAQGAAERALNQAARELLLAQSSDWAFIMTTGTAVSYAVRRTREHVYRFHTLYEQIKNNQIDDGFLRDLEWKDSIFQEIDYRVYA
ncbi:MAG: 1,4-alpha-glucan branching protein domain-containing protein [Candidatus Omnitrophota bacterium]